MSSQPQPKPSLMRPAQEQLELMSSAAMPPCFFARDEASLCAGEFTAERLWARQPEKYRLVVSLLAEKLGLIRIGRVLGLSPNTVAAVRDREGVAIDIEKKELGAKAMRAAHLAIEGVIEDLSDPARRAEIETRDKALIGAMMTDKGLLLHGEATVRLEVNANAPEHDSYNRYLEGLRSAATEVSPPMSLGEGKNGGNAGGPPGPAALPEASQES